MIIKVYWTEKKDAMYIVHIPYKNIMNINN